MVPRHLWSIFLKTLKSIPRPKKIVPRRLGLIFLKFPKPTQTPKKIVPRLLWPVFQEILQIPLKTQKFVPRLLWPVLREILQTPLWPPKKIMITLKLLQTCGGSTLQYILPMTNVMLCLLQQLARPGHYVMYGY